MAGEIPLDLAGPKMFDEAARQYQEQEAKRKEELKTSQEDNLSYQVFIARKAMREVLGYDIEAFQVEMDRERVPSQNPVPLINVAGWLFRLNHDAPYRLQMAVPCRDCDAHNWMPIYNLANVGKIEVENRENPWLCSHCLMSREVSKPVEVPGLRELRQMAWEAIRKENENAQELIRFYRAELAFRASSESKIERTKAG